MLGREELLARRDELRERFSERMHDSRAEDFIGFSLVSAGVSQAIIMAVRRRRSVLSYLVPAAFVLAGLAVLGNGFYGRWNERVGTAEDNVRGELAALDPIARARVLRDIAGESIPLVRHSAESHN